MKKTLVIYNSLKNDICFVKLNVDKEIKYNELDDKAVMSAMMRAAKKVEAQD